MKFIITTDEAYELHDAIIKVLTKDDLPGTKVMCHLFPTRGLYVAEGVVREVLKEDALAADLGDYFCKMPYGDYLAFEASVTVLEKYNDR